MKSPWTALALASALLHPPAFGADEVTDALQAAYAPYRAALFRTNSGSKADSEQAVAASRKAWQEVLQRYGSRVPPPYDRDVEFRPTLAKVDAVIARSQDLVRSDRLPQAHEALEEVRDLLADLRARNGVITFSDHMNAYHAEMEHVLAQGGALLEQAGGPSQLLERAAVLGYLAQRLREAAPPALARDAEFLAAQAAVEASVAKLRAALLQQDVGAARLSLDGLKGPYGRMFLKFG